VWANWGIVGLALLALIAFTLIRSTAEVVSGGAGDVLVAYLCCWSLWNLAFSPFVVSVPVLVLAVGLSLRARSPAGTAVIAGRTPGS
jgi:hypothetical protein